MFCTDTYSLHFLVHSHSHSLQDPFLKRSYGAVILKCPSFLLPPNVAVLDTKEYQALAPSVGAPLKIQFSLLKPWVSHV